MDMAAPPVWLVLVRGVHDAAVLSLLGAFCFAPFVLPRRYVCQIGASLRWLACISGAVALIAGILWFLGEASMVAEAHGIAATLGAVPAFLAYVRFGQILVVRLVMIVAALALVSRPHAALAPASVAVALQPWLGHAAQLGAGLATLEILHVVAAGIWFGSLIPLLLCLRLLPAGDAAQTLRSFSRIGVLAVLTLAGTGLAQGVVLAGGAGGLIHTTYGHVALIKLALFALALGLAACNNLILTPRLARSTSTSKPLRVSIANEAMIGVAIVLAAGWLANLAPG